MTALYISIGVLVALAALWLFMIAAKRDKRMDSYAGAYFAHRGLHGKLDLYEGAAPENSLKAFSRAVEQGFGIELDVRQTKDGQIVVFHDDDLVRAAGIDRKISDMTYDELVGVSLFGTDERIPLFEEVLALVAAKVPLLVEIKDDGYKSTPAAVMQILSTYSGEYITESFNPLVMGAVKKAAPDVMRGFLCDHLTLNSKYRGIKYAVVQRNLLNFIARPHFIAGNFENLPIFPTGIIRRLFRPAMLAWTVRSEEEEKTARSKGFTGMIFEGYIPEGKSKG